jgi:hypothetical protein
MSPLVCVTLSPLSVLWQLDGAFGEVGEEIEGLAEGVLGRSRECARRVHRVRFMAGVKEGTDGIAEVWCSTLCTGRYGLTLPRWTLKEKWGRI